MVEPVDLKNIDCLNCIYRYRSGGNDNTVHEYDRCRKAKASKAVYTNGLASGEYIGSILKYPHRYPNVTPKDCGQRFITEKIKNSRMWVHLYFKGLEKEPVVIEPNKHEVMVLASWWVRKLFGVADRFHQWQDARAVKRAEKLVEKRKTVLLTHIVKELPRL